MRPFDSLKDAEIWMDENAFVGMRGMSVYLARDVTKVRCSLHWTIPNRVGGYYDESAAMIFRVRGQPTFAAHLVKIDGAGFHFEGSEEWTLLH